MDANPRRGGHICQCLRRISRLRRHSVFTIFGERRKTGLQFVESVRSLALGLSQLGVRPGQVVAIAALNSDLYLEWMLAVAYAGAIVAPLNYRWSLEEAKSALDVLKPIMLILDDSCSLWHSDLQTFDMSSLKWHVRLGDSLNHYPNVLTTAMIKKPLEEAVALIPDYQWAPDGVVLICFTSGTSGRPKGVAIDHTALIIQSLAKIAIVGYNEDDIASSGNPIILVGDELDIVLHQYRLKNCMDKGKYDGLNVLETKMVNTRDSRNCLT